MELSIKKLLIVFVLLFGVFSVAQAAVDNWYYVENYSAVNHTGSWTPAVTNVYDGDWGTSAYRSTVGGGDFVYGNYTKEDNFVMPVLWQVKDIHGTVNLTLPQSCWDAHEDVIEVYAYNLRQGAARYAAWGCMNETGWDQLRFNLGVGQGELYEDGMFFSTRPEIDSVVIWDADNSTRLEINDTLYGWCTATDAGGDDVSYSYEWWKNGAMIDNGTSAYSSEDDWRVDSTAEWNDGTYYNLTSSSGNLYFSASNTEGYWTREYDCGVDCKWKNLENIGYWDGDWEEYDSFETGFDGWSCSGYSCARDNTWSTNGSWSIKMQSALAYQNSQYTYNSVIAAKQIYFDWKYTASGFGFDSVKLQVNQGSGWQTVWSRSTGGAANGTTIDLENGYFNYSLRFITDNKYGSTFYLDNVRFYETRPGIKLQTSKDNVTWSEWTDWLEVDGESLLDDVNASRFLRMNIYMWDPDQDCYVSDVEILYDKSVVYPSGDPLMIDEIQTSETAAGDEFIFSCEACNSYGECSGNSMTNSSTGYVYDIDYTNISEVLEGADQLFQIFFDGFLPSWVESRFYQGRGFIEESTLESVWLLDEGNGTQVDDTMGVRNGTFNNDPDWVTGFDGNPALYFNGVNESVEFGNASNMLNFERDEPFSVSFWVKESGTVFAQVIGRMTNAIEGWSIGIGNNQPVLILSNTWPTNTMYVGTTAQVLNDSQWDHVVVTYDGSSSASGAKFYINGVEITATTALADTLSASIQTTANLSMGANSMGTIAQFNGTLDNMAIWNGTILNLTQILDIYNDGDYVEYNEENMTAAIDTFSNTRTMPYVNTTTEYTYEYRWLENTTQRVELITFDVVDFNINPNNGTLFLNISFRDEQTKADITPNMEMDSIWTVYYADGGTDTISVNTTGQAEFYIVPDGAVVQVDAEFKYSKPGYRQRTHFFINRTIGDDVENMVLYTINDSDTISTPITFTLIDYDTAILPDYYIDIQRWYIDDNGYSTISLSKTDVEAKSVVYLEPFTAFYRILVYDGLGNTVYTASRQIITQSDISVQLGSALDSTVWNDYSSLSYTYSANKTTGEIITTVTDTSGGQITGDMTITQMGLLSDTEICTSTGTGSAVLLSCTIPTNTTDTFSVGVDVTKGSNVIPLIGEYVSYSDSTFGTDGIVAAFMIIGTLAFMGLGSPHAAIVLTIVGLIVSWQLGFILTGFASILSLVGAGIAIIMVMRK